MRIRAYKYLFALDPETKVSRPSGQGIELSISASEPEVWIMNTYDSGEVFRTHGFYQLAFSIDLSPYSRNDIDVVVGIGDGNEFHGKENYLDYDPVLNLWYHQRRIKKKNKAEEYLPTVTTAGVFKVFIRHKPSKSILDTSPWIYVLPKDISLSQYIHMLSDLIFLNDQLIKSDSSVVGVGSLLDEGAYILDWAKELRQRVSILQKPQNTAVQLLKRYVKTDIRKVHKFDAHVLKSYIHNGSTGKIDGIEHYESRDTYENRVIKSVLMWLNLYFEEAFLSHSLIGSSPDVTNKHTIGTEENRRLVESKTRQIELYNQNRKTYETYKKNIEEAKEIIVSILNNHWFDQITEIDGFHFPIRETPKFLYDTNYSKIYQLLSTLEEQHYLLSGNIDINAFGVTHTQQVYEYWVFYKILYHLYKLGFSINEQGQQQISKHFREYVENERDAKGYCLKLSKQISEKECMIEVGYNCWIGTLTPDYYIRFIDGNENHWYFMDAKYKPYGSISEEEENAYSIFTEIREVAVNKYITRMSENELNSDPKYRDMKNTICGSYLIVAILRDDAGELDIGDRLFGGGKLDSSSFLSVNNEHGMAEQRYGAIQLLPDNDEELTMLMELIFEYKENKWKNVCWRCGSTDIKIEHQSQHSSSADWITCHKCGAFRADNHCNTCHKPIIKHSNGNYHKAVDNQKWMFVCPCCGSGGSLAKPRAIAFNPNTSEVHENTNSSNPVEEREPWYPSWYKAQMIDTSESAAHENRTVRISSSISIEQDTHAEEDFFEDVYDQRHGLSKPGYNSYGSYWRKRDHRDSNEI